MPPEWRRDATSATTTPDASESPARHPRTARPGRADPRTVLLCDPMTLFREGLARRLPYLGPFRIVATTAFLDETVRDVRELDPDVIVASTQLADATIDDLARRLLELDANARLVALCTEGHPCANFSVPVDGAVRRSAPIEDLLAALLAPERGPARSVPPNPRPVRAGPCASGADPTDLAPRLICILTLVARGWSNRDIGRWLGVSEKTVRDYLTDAYRDLHVRSRTEAALVMLRRGYGPAV